jgi:hypothetical protein
MFVGLPRFLKIAPGGQMDGGQEFQEDGVFLGARGAESGADLVEVGVGIAGVADEFPGLAGVVGDGGEEGAQGFLDVEVAGGEDADGAAGGGEACGADGSLEGSVLGAEGDDSEAAEAA